MAWGAQGSRRYDQMLQNRVTVAARDLRTQHNIIHSCDLGHKQGANLIGCGLQSRVKFHQL